MKSSKGFLFQFSQLLTTASTNSKGLTEQQQQQNNIIFFIPNLITKFRKNQEILIKLRDVFETIKDDPFIGV